MSTNAKSHANAELELRPLEDNKLEIVRGGVMSEADLDKVTGGAVDSYMYFQKGPNPTLITETQAFRFWTGS